MNLPEALVEVDVRKVVLALVAARGTQLHGASIGGGKASEAEAGAGLEHAVRGSSQTDEASGSEGGDSGNSHVD